MSEIIENELVERQETQAAIAPDANTRLMESLVTVISDPNTDLERVNQSIDIMERLQSKVAQQAFNVAMAEAQAEMHPVVHDKENTQTHSKYTSLAALDRALRPIYTRHGLSLSFNTGKSDNPDNILITCLLTHKDGYSPPLYVYDAPADGKGAKGNAVMTRTHAAGSAISYGQRYLLKMIFNISTGKDDDDGNGAGETVPKITEEQAMQINAMLDDNGLDRGQFMAWLDREIKCGDIDEINVNAFDRCVNVINQTIAKHKAKQA